MTNDNEVRITTDTYVEAFGILLRGGWRKMNRGTPEIAMFGFMNFIDEVHGRGLYFE